MTLGGRSRDQFPSTRTISDPGVGGAPRTFMMGQGTLGLRGNVEPMGLLDPLMAIIHIDRTTKPHAYSFFWIKGGKND